jgi:hypothetical protein
MCYASCFPPHIFPAQGNYKVVDGAPRNPVQRTGVRGRGSLPHWGPNHRGNPVITRWCRRRSDGEVHTRLGRRVLEVLCCRVDPGGANPSDEDTNAAKDNPPHRSELELLSGPLGVNGTLPAWVAEFFRVPNDTSVQKKSEDRSSDRVSDGGKARSSRTSQVGVQFTGASTRGVDAVLGTSPAPTARLFSLLKHALCFPLVSRVHVTHMLLSPHHLVH